ncbi:MAG: hypothetical protein PHQ23_04360 [Candidatus Wallbacteria bacterium]|nr:hypothetical protein [Candidatus Wallbacteria bacterium]
MPPDKEIHCWDIHVCPAAEYLSCEAYKSGKNCWEVREKPCCKRNDFARCLTCPVYLQYLKSRK